MRIGAAGRCSKAWF